MGKITELTVTKGRTLRAGDREEWLRIEFSVKAVVEDEAELNVAKAHVEGLIDGWLSGALGAPASVGAKPEQPKKAERKEPAKPFEGPKPADLFPEDLRGLLSFEDQADWTIIKPRQFLGTENFAKIAEIVRKHNGDYISAGKESHFRIPRKAAK
jgi:hypothetical protein